MGFVGSMLGAGQGSSFVANQAGYTPPSSAVTEEDIAGAKKAATGALGSQNALLNALQSQQTQGIANQTQLGGQLANQAQGLGPNPALAQLNQTTGQNVQNQAALMAGQRGAGANVGLMARQAAQQGAATQQNAVGQGAIMAAQQQLNAQQQLAGLSANQIGQAAAATGANTQAAQAQQNAMLGSQGQFNQAQANMLNSINSTNSATQIQNSQAQQGIFGGVLGGAGSMLAEGGDVEKPQKFADGSGMITPMQMPTLAAAPVQAAPAPLPSAGASSGFGKYLQDTYGPNAPANQMNSNNSGLNAGANQIKHGTGVLSKAGFQAVKSALSKGKSPGDTSEPGSAPNLGVEGIDSTAPANPFNLGVEGIDSSAAGSSGAGLGVDTSMGTEAAGTAAGEAAAGEAAGSGGFEGLAALLSRGGNVGSQLKSGGHVPGKPKVGGKKNSYSNDNVKALLSPGEIVLPRSVTMSEDPIGNASKFVAQVMAKRRASK